ncbi:homeodomain-interacting protein kinase 1-like [Centropristis striata]|uniref:homeodomain-interacting protein kinase 1-like n=1 Tax=Centropristis striata TaxID=184440 RepID=UPI0027E0F5DF|nr:homeodomain-interacting protein kinase 1-like [Centropristis striata]
MGFCSSSSSSHESYLKHQIPLPKGYKYVQVLGEGAFGKVVQCVQKDTRQTVAIKIARRDSNLDEEAHMLSKLMHHNMDKFNIVKYHDKVNINNSVGLVFEMMDITLQDYLLELDGPMPLENIRTAIQQLATAFSGLKRIGVIHTDVKMNNIMIADQNRQPFKVKLIDFGLAIFNHQAKTGRVCQTPFYRAPEIMLGLPFSEEIDIWSLGCVMAIMVLGVMPFPGRIEYDALRYIIDLIGPPPDHLLDAGLKSNLFFKKTDSNQWILKTPEEYWESAHCSMDERFYTFRSLDDVKKMRLEENNETEAEDREQCIELLKAMLTWDGKERITPDEILNHPFITKSYLRSSSRPRFYASLWKSATQYRTPKTTKETQDRYDDENRTSHQVPFGVPVVRPADPENRIPLYTPYGLDSDICPHSDTAYRTHHYNTDLPPTTFDDNKRKKNKKSRINRFFSWMKGKFCSKHCEDNTQK